MKKLVNILTAFFILIAASALISCTDNQKARQYGGTEEIELKPNEIYLSSTWKGKEGTDLWVCTKDTLTGICYMREKSSFGVLEGTIIFK